MAYISFQPNDYFNTKLYTGTGSELAITGVGFQPDFTWIKKRSATKDHAMTDAVRGATKIVYSNDPSAQDTNAQTLKSFDSDGFTLGTHGLVNDNSGTYVAWNWKIGTTSGIATNGSTNITPSAYSFNQTTGVSAIAYTGTGVDGAYLPHGLGKAPELLLLKSTSLNESWNVYSKRTGNQGRGHLNNADAFDTSRGEWYSTTPDTVNMRISNDSHINSSGATCIAYFFTSIKGFSSIGGYRGNGSAHGPFIHTGFKPAFVLGKNVDQGSQHWFINDNKRLGYNGSSAWIKPDSTGAELTNLMNCDFCSNGFKLRNNDSIFNQSNQTFIYMAYAENPFVASNGDPANAG